MKITVPFKKLSTIAHIADIHIRLFKRHDEYRIVFDRLYDQLKTKNLKDGVIVVAGDILHAKTDMSPEMVQLASEFLGKLADIAPTLVIAGNHDLNLSNMNRLDSLTPLISNLNHKNLHYLKHSGVYRIADTDIAVFSILDEPAKWPAADECTSHRKIALFHGPVHGSVTDAKFVITNRHVNVSTFAGFDMVLLGDIHKYQVLQHYNPAKNQPIIVYSSSLIQQNHGESLENHGWCLWDVDAVSHTFIPTLNDYGYFTLELVDGKYTLPATLPKNLRLRLFTGGAEQTVIKKLLAVLRKHYTISELSVNKSKFDTVALGKAKSQLDQIDITDVNTQATLITDWITRKFPDADPAILKTVTDINKKLNNAITHEDHSRNVHWKPLELKFSNMFSYGEDNIIRFNTMKGIYGIFAPNASGKSSSIDALMFCLYDKTPRAFKGDHIINNRKDTFECQLKFQIDSDIYYVRRVGTRKKTGDVKVDVTFWKENADGTITSLNGEDRRDTNANIRSYVGSYEDFVLTALSSQNSSALFIDKSHSERKDLLIQFMGLNIFDLLYNTANDEVKEISGQLKRFKNIDFTQTLVDTQNKLEWLTEKNKQAESEFSAIKDDQENLYTTLKYWQNQKRPLPTDTPANLNKLSKEMDLHGSTKDRLLKRKADLENRLALDELDLARHTEKYAEYDAIELLAERTRLYNQEAEAARSHIDAQTVLLASKVEKQKLLDSLREYTFNPECDVCVANSASHIEQIKTAENDILSADKTLVALDSKARIAITMRDSVKDAPMKYKEALELRDKIKLINAAIASTHLEIKSAAANISNTDSQLKSVQRDIDAYYLNQENIEFNNTVMANIETIESSIADRKIQLDAVEKILRQLHGEIKVHEASKADILRQIKEAEALEESYEAYEYYMLAIGRDGVPYEIMSRTIPRIESEINAILSQIVDFTISLEVDDKNIVSKLNYDHERIWPLENSSGMERFISSIAIRVALLNASNLPKSNFLMIDEGFGTLDAENLGSMSTLFTTLKSQFDFILIISHLDSSRDMVDKVIEIKKEDGYSFINV